MKPFVALGTVGEAAGLAAGGYRPLGAIFGVSVVSVGDAIAESPFDGAELRNKADAVRLAVENARRRALDEAASLGATAIVGTRFEIVHEAFDAEIVEVRCLGTAVAGGEVAKPIMTTLAGPDLLVLTSAGYVPLGIAVGYCFYTQIPGFRTSNAMGNRGALGIVPFEHADYTRAIYQAREIASSRLQTDAAALGAEGVLGLDLRPVLEKSRETMKIGVFAAGTAVRRSGLKPMGIEPPLTIVGLG